jgi:hypothetical protein
MINMTSSRARLQLARGRQRAINELGGGGIPRNSNRIADNAGPALKQFHYQCEIVSLHGRHERVASGRRINLLDAGAGIKGMAHVLNATMPDRALQECLAS